jgi:hypothetical protein
VAMEMIDGETIKAVEANVSAGYPWMRARSS